MSRTLAVLAVAATLGSALPQSAEAQPFDRRGTLALIAHDIQREDSRVFVDRERGETIEASLSLGTKRYALGLQRPQHHEFLLVIETRDGARCAGLETIIVGTRSGRIYHGVCRASIGLNHRAAPAYYEAELDRLLGLFHPLLAPHATARREES